MLENTCTGRSSVSEKDTLSNLTDITNQIISLEKKSREQLLASESYQDTVWRALGILKTARVMSSSEFAGLYSALRVGVAEGLVNGMTLGQLSEAYESVQPARLMEQYGNELNSAQRDKKRAEILRAVFKNTDIA